MLKREQLEDAKKCGKCMECSCHVRLGCLANEGELIETALELLDKTEAQEKEIKQLKAERDGLYLHTLEVENGNIDMQVSGDRAKLFFATLVQIFKQNGGKNYLCQSVEVGKGAERYSITIQNMNGEITPAEKLNQQSTEIEQLNAQNAAYKSALDDMYFAYDNKDADCPHQFEIDAVKQYMELSTKVIGGGQSD